MYRHFMLNYELYSVYLKVWHFPIYFQKYYTDPVARGRAYFGQANGEIYLENVECEGGESYLLNCSSSGTGVHSCDHSEDAGVQCQGKFGLHKFEVCTYK